MSWAAHELESYVIQKHCEKHLKTRVSYIAILLGCFLPDLITKGTVYGFSVGGFDFHPKDTDLYHRGWPGVGFTHSPLYGALLALLVLWVTKSRPWAAGLLIGHWAHVVTDVCDSVGVMLLFPFSTQTYDIGMWAYAAQEGRYGDATAYYSSLGGVWDLFWLVVALCSYQVLSRRYFFGTVVKDDPAWPWMQRRLRLSEVAMVALYRAYFVYGAGRIFAWFCYARFVEKAPLDLSWGGPYWVEAVDPGYPPVGELLLRSALGVAGMAITLTLLWRFAGRPAWRRATRAAEAGAARTTAAGPAPRAGAADTADTPLS
jgi:membrane-bound metal-dependent hydrolase YbcI (DUF457 family)